MKLMGRLQISKFTDKQSVVSDLRWLEPIQTDEQKRSLWEVVNERLDQLDAIAERVRQQREEHERQKAEQRQNSKPSLPSSRNDKFEP